MWGAVNRQTLTTTVRQLLASDSSLVALRVIFRGRKRAVALTIGVLGTEIMPAVCQSQCRDVAAHWAIERRL